MEVFFIGDLHLNHKNILKFRNNIPSHITTIDEYDDWVIERWNTKVTKRDKVFITGDFAFKMQGIKRAKDLKGHKVLVKGNHDKFHISQYYGYMEDVVGFLSYKGKFWISHCPIHPVELRGKYNIHGHVHHNSIDDPRYINTSFDVLDGYPISFDEIKSGLDI